MAWNRFGTRRRVGPTVPRAMTAKYPGTCAGCFEAVRPGDAIVWHGRGLAYHAACVEGTDAAVPAPADRGLARAVAAGLGEDYADDDADYRRHRARDDADYAQGVADGERYSSDRKLYGEALAEQWAMDSERFAYNNGLDD